MKQIGVIILVLLYTNISVPYSPDSLDYYGEKYGMSSNLIKAIIRVESNFDPNAVSPDGSVGLMQIQCPTARDMGVKDCKKLKDPKTNIETGLKYFRFLQQKYMHIFKSLDAYNRGPGKADKSPYNGDWRTHRYVGKIICVMEAYDGVNGTTESDVESCFNKNRYRIRTNDRVQ